MRDKGIKYQITIPKELSDRIEIDMEQTYLTKSAWFIKLAKEYLDDRDKAKKGKKLIELDIE